LEELKCGEISCLKLIGIGKSFFAFRTLPNSNSDQKQVDWVTSFYTLMKALIAYIKAHYHPQGVKWNPDGVTATEALKEIKSSPSPSLSAGGPPPPPPPPLPTAAQLEAHAKPKSAPSGGGEPGGVLSQLNQGSAITSGLKKVDPSQQTHKNPSLRSAAPVITRSNSQASTKSIPPGTKPKPESMRTKKPPKKELDGNKWLIVRCFSFFTLLTY
jgi:adenylyl cyclase-associated protein